jgi:E3 ubiquitin-protein ligase HUWE1
MSRSSDKKDLSEGPAQTESSGSEEDDDDDDESDDDDDEMEEDEDREETPDLYRNSSLGM